LFWKDEWLKPCGEEQPVGVGSGRMQAALGNDSILSEKRCSEDEVWRASRMTDPFTGESRYVCQATELLAFTTPLSPRNMGQYIEDYTSRNATIAEILRTFFDRCLRPFNRRLRPLRMFHDWFKALFGGIPFPYRIGTVPDGKPTPVHTLDLQPGELVQIKSYPEILATLGGSNKNRGLLFSKEMVPFCGGTFRVRTRVNSFVDEKSGKLRKMKTPAVILDNVWCQSRYAECRLLCPRSIYPWWREVWLRRVQGCQIDRSTPFTPSED
jgi:hypothetical protein